MASSTVDQFIDPHRLYTRDGFIGATGLGDTSLRMARKQHNLDLPTIRVGRRDYIRGADAIAFVLRLAELQAERAASEAAQD